MSFVFISTNGFCLCSSSFFYGNNVGAFRYLYNNLGGRKWIMQAILIITAAIVAFKNSDQKGKGRTGRAVWIGVIAIILIAIGLNFVPTIADTLFGIKFG